MDADHCLSLSCTECEYKIEVRIIVSDCLFYYSSILEKEGPSSLFRGLGPNLVGVAPSRYSKNTSHTIVAQTHVVQKCYSTYM